MKKNISQKLSSYPTYFVNVYFNLLMQRCDIW